MRVILNPIPWLFAPGVALAGWYFGGSAGALQALGGWAGVVAAATAWVVLRRRYGPRDHPEHAP